jgi:hypothetical protein
MSIKRTIQCDICGCEQHEPMAGDGFTGWAGLHGVVLDGVADPQICPSCLNYFMPLLEAYKTKGTPKCPGPT